MVGKEPNIVDKYEVSQILREMAFFIELLDENPKKSIAYRRAALSIETCENFNHFLEKNSLEDISGIGKTLSKMIIILIKENQLNYYTKLKNSVPNTILELVNVGLSVKKIRKLYENFKIVSINDLENALEQKKIIGTKRI